MSNPSYDYRVIEIINQKIILQRRESRGWWKGWSNWEDIETFGTTKADSEEAVTKCQALCDAISPRIKVLYPVDCSW